MSLRQPSKWCAERFGPRKVESNPKPRPFDIPWIVLDSQAASDFWNWTPSTSRNTILEEIATHAEKNPEWLEMVA